VTAFAPQRLDRTLTCWRIGDPEGRFPIFDARGSILYPGRWNTSQSPVIYAAENFATAMLEKLAHGKGAMPPNQHAIEITCPAGLSYEIVTKDKLRGWDRPEPDVSCRFGERWVNDARSAILIAPSFVARVERNIIINPVHPEFGTIRYALPEPVYWDTRLFT
jgi:RES domain-containing protein